MASDRVDSTEPAPAPFPLLLATRGARRDANAPQAWIESGVFIETTPAGRLARVVGPGDLIQDEGVWITDGCFREDDAAPESPDDRTRRRTAAEARLRQLKIRLDCLMSHAGAARLADLLAAIQQRTADSRLVMTQQDLAELVGQRRATVNEGLQALQDRKIVKVGRGRIDIHDVLGLDRAACGCESGGAAPTTSSADGGESGD